MAMALKFIDRVFVFARIAWVKHGIYAFQCVSSVEQGLGCQGSRRSQRMTRP